jgi:hypothetical protein
MPVVVSNKAASDGGAGKPHPGASPAVPPSANDGGAADAGSDAPSGETQMDAIINNEGVSIPVDVDPLVTSGGANKAAADASAVPTRGPSPEPIGVSESDASGAAPASDDGTAVTDDASAVPAAPARVPSVHGLRPLSNHGARTAASTRSWPRGACDATKAANNRGDMV